MNEECISVLTYLTAFVLLLPKFFFDEVIMVDSNRIIKFPDIEFGQLLRFIGIWLLMTENPGTNRAEYFRKNPIDIFSGCSIDVNQLMSGNSFKISALLSSSLPSLSLPFEINYMKPNR